MEDEAIYLNEVGGGNYTTINYFNYNKLTEDVAGKQDEIQDGDLTIAKTDGLQTALNEKQPTIDGATDLTSKSLTTTDLVVNESLNINNVITYEKYKQFDTLVLRRDPEADNENFNVYEIQVWVNDTHIMYQNANILSSYFADWEDDKNADLGQYLDNFASKIYNNIIDTNDGAGAVSGEGDPVTALIIKNIPLTFVNDIQAIVFYNRRNFDYKAIGLLFELYNSKEDADYLKPLAVTTPISVENQFYRFDFPSFDTYTLGTSTGSSTTQITSNVVIEDAIINTFDAEVNITGNLNVNGGVDIDTGEYFDTLVLRFPDLETTNNIQINELQVWVNGSNLLVENSATLTSYFAEWEVDKNEDLGEFEGNNTSNVFNNVIESK
jgi:hypothetical protein